LGIVSRSAVAVRFGGDDLDPALISAALGATPELAYAKGGAWATPAGKPMVGRTGVWNLSVPDRAPADLDAQLAELFALLTSDMAVWRELSARFDGDVFVGLFLATGNGLAATKHFNEGLGIEPQTLSAVASRGLRFEFDIYAGRDVARRGESRTR
jgi:Domain of unknown function (DUF4279)